jgi:RimJ/RimL family protein N-acetyltransferase
MLQTSRLVIRDWRDDEADRVFDMYSRWEVARFLGAQPRVLEERAQAVKVIERWRNFNAEDPRFGCWACVRRGHRRGVRRGVPAERGVAGGLPAARHDTHRPNRPVYGMTVEAFRLANKRQ